MVSALMLAYFGPVVIGARSRLLSFGFWDISTFMINGALWVFVGTQIPGALHGINHVDSGLRHAVHLALAVTAVTVVTRFAWVEFSAVLGRAVDRSMGRPSRAVNFRQRCVTSWAGFRGAVSLAAALAVPLTTLSGAPFPERSLLIFVVVVVILVTVIVQGTTLPAVVRWANMPEDVARCNELQLARSVGRPSRTRGAANGGRRTRRRPNAAGSSGKGIPRTRRGGDGQRRRSEGA